MKNSKLFKRSLLLLAVVALAVVLTIGIVAGAATISEGNAGYGEVYAGVNVSVKGQVALRFYFSDLGTAKEFVAEITDPAGNTTSKTTYPVDSINKVTVVSGEQAQELYRVSVSLAPSQMTYSVKLYANGADGAGKAYVYSVKKYAQDVIADTNLSKDHDAMRALLNWGAMAQLKFSDSVDSLANDGIFARGTNPANAVKDIPDTSITPVSSTNETVFPTANGAVSLNVYLSNTDVAMGFIFPYNGEGTLTADVYKNGVLVKKDDAVVLEKEGYWRANVRDLTATCYDDVYKVVVKDGTNTMTAEYSILAYVDYVIADGAKASDGSIIGEDQKNVCRAMYQFYQNATGLKVTDCAHNASIYWLSNGDGTDSYRCSACFTDYAGAKVPESVTLYYSPYEFATTAKLYNGNGCSFNLTDGVYYATSDDNIEIIWARNHEDQNANGAGTTAYDATIEVGNAKYFVIKVKSTDTAATLNLRISTPGKSHDGANRGYTHAHIWEANDTKPSDWTTYVIDLEAVYNGYYIKNDGETTYTLDTYFYGCAGEFDVAYVAFVEDDWSAIKTLTGEKEVTKIINANGDSMQVNTTDGGCAKHGNITETLTEDACTYTCDTCGVVLKTITLTKGVEVFYSAYNMSTPVAKATDDKLTPNIHVNMDSKEFKFENGTPFFTFKGKDSTVQLIWMRATGSDHEKYCVDMGQAKYMVIKARGTADAINNVRVYFRTAGSTAAVGNSKFKLPLNAAGAGEWGVYVIDMSAVLSDHYKKSDTDTYKLDFFYIVSNGNLAKTETIDIGYVAFVDDWTDIDSIVDEKKVYNVTNSGNSYTELILNN